MTRHSLSLMLGLSFCSAQAFADISYPEVSALRSTTPLINYDEAPATPDADDPAIWVNPADRTQSLVIGTLKDAGLIVYNLAGNVVQTMAAPNRPTVTALDPPTPAGIAADSSACPESRSGETYGRYNNVAILQGIALTTANGGQRLADVAVVTDRGCDRLRVFEIDPSQSNGPLRDITSTAAQRVFPQVIVQPSPLQPSELTAGQQANPLDDQSTAYGVGTAMIGGRAFAFVSQRSRGVVAQIELLPLADGTVGYAVRRLLQFDPNFTLSKGRRSIQWTPCREDAVDDPQSEGIVIDSANGLLYVAFETIGVYRIPLSSLRGSRVVIGLNNLWEPLKTFGVAYQAIPDDDEFECVYAPTEAAEEGTIVAEGLAGFAGNWLEPDVEGLTIYDAGRGRGYLIASSQGDDSFHIYDRQGKQSHRAAFAVADTGETDGLELVSQSLGGDFRSGLLVVQNGDAEGPADESPINGYEFDGSTQFRFIRLEDVMATVAAP